MTDVVTVGAQEGNKQCHMRLYLFGTVRTITCVVATETIADNPAAMIMLINKLKSKPTRATAVCSLGCRQQTSVKVLDQAQQMKMIKCPGVRTLRGWRELRIGSNLFISIVHGCSYEDIFLDFFIIASRPGPTPIQDIGT